MRADSQVTVLKILIVFHIFLTLVVFNVLYRFCIKLYILGQRFLRMPLIAAFRGKDRWNSSVSLRLAWFT